MKLPAGLFQSVLFGLVGASLLSFACRAAPMPLESAEEAKKIIARARNGYANLKSYSDRSEFVTVYETNRPSNQAPVVSKLVFAAPNRFRVDFESGVWYGPGGLVSDGKQLTSFAIESGAYVQQAAPTGGMQGELEQSNAVIDTAPWHLGLLLTGHGAPEYLFDGVRAIQGCRSQILNDRGGKVVVASGAIPGQPANAESDVEWYLWFDDQTGLLGQVTLDMTKRQQAKSDDSGEGVDEAKRVTRFASILTMRDVVANPKVEENDFVFRPEPGAEKVSRFRTEGDSSEKFAEFIGAAAPAIETKILSGDKFSLAALKGRVVVLDFWATWCGPCVHALPFLQEMSVRLKDEPVTFVGVSQDQGMEPEKLTAWLEKKKITMVEILDESREIASSYGVSGIPQLVLIDQKGIVQSIDVGFGGKQTATKIETAIRDLLAGKSVFDAEKVAAMRAQAQNPSDAGVLRWTPGAQVQSADVAKSPEVNPQSLVIRSKSAPGISTNRLVECDLGPAGGVVLVSPAWDGTSAIVTYSVTGQKTRRVLLRDLDGRAVSSAFAFAAGNEVRYLAYSSKTASNSWMQRSPLISCHDSTGKILWKHEPPATGDFECSAALFAADVWGKGVTNPIATLVISYTKKIDENSYETLGTSAQVLVFGDTGEVRAARTIDVHDAPVIRLRERTERAPAAILLISSGRVSEVELPQKLGQ